MSSLIDAPLTIAPALRSEIRADDRKVDNLSHLTRLANGMTRNGQDVRDWTYTGEVADSGPFGASCTCGHPIRWVFTIVNTKTSDILPIGSVCIGTSVPYLISHGNETLAAQLQAAVEKLRKDLAEAERRERDARNDVIASALLEYGKELNCWRRLRLDRYRAQRRFAPEHIYRQLKLNANSTPGRTASAAKKKIVNFLLAAVLEGRTDEEAKGFPTPPDSPEGLKDDIRTALRAELDAHDARIAAEAARRAKSDAEFDAKAAAFRARHGLS
jgi:hypothetical protein